MLYLVIQCDFSIRDFQGAHTITHFDDRELSPTCEWNNGLSISISIAKTLTLKIDDYDDQIRNYIGGSFMPCVFTSGTGIDPASIKVLNYVARKAIEFSFERYLDIKEEIKCDVMFFLHNSRIQDYLFSDS